MTNEEITKQLSEARKLKPNDLIMDDLQWKYLVWAVIRGKNILFVGPTRSGKTKAAKSVADVFSTTETKILTEEELSLLKSNPHIKLKKIVEIPD